MPFSGRAALRTGDEGFDPGGCLAPNAGSSGGVAVTVISTSDQVCLF
jgi:hypothetical protein